MHWLKKIFLQHQRPDTEPERLLVWIDEIHDFQKEERDGEGS